MIDSNETSAIHYFDDLEDNADAACLECAIKNGYTKSEAEVCEDGNLNCTDCPFIPLKREAKNEN